MKPKFVHQKLPSESTKTVWMKPKDFLELSLPKKGGRYHEPSYDPRSLKRLKGRMEQNLIIDPPEFEVEAQTGQIIDHSGRHRALTAHKLGISEIPVVVKYVGYERSPSSYDVEKVEVPLSKIPMYYDLKPEIKRRKYEMDRMVE